MQEPIVSVTTKVTKDHEILDINGFQLKRRRVTNAENVSGNDARTPHQQLGSAAVAGPSPCVDEYDVDEDLYYRLTRNLQALHDTAKAADRLVTLCNSVCDAEAAKAPNDEAGQAMHDVFAAFVTALRQATDVGEIQLADAPAEGQGLPSADLHVDLEARKAGLRTRIAKFQQEEAEWTELMEKMNQMETELQNFDLEEDAVEEEKNPESSEIAALRQLKSDVHRKMAMQVEGVCLLVGDVEELVQKANMSAQSMQAEYHQEKFVKSFPHVNSPAALIKALVKKN